MPALEQTPKDQKPAAFAAIEGLQDDATTPEDRRQLAEWQDELDKERGAAISGGHSPEPLAMLPDGSVVPKAEAQAAQQAGELSHPYGNSGRRA